MKYNKSFSGQSFEQYKAYLKTIKHKLPQSLYQFISDSRRHDLENLSLHDSWTNHINIKVNRERENRFATKTVSIKIELLGPYHDRTFTLHFSDVVSYRIGAGEHGHHDLITYEIYYEDKNDLLVFNAEFADKNKIKIKSKNFRIIEKLF
jgi:hypothetical protein